MKYRIIECNKGGQTWYEVQWMCLFFWVTDRNSSGHPKQFCFRGEAQDYINQEAAPTTRKIVR